MIAALFKLNGTPRLASKRGVLIFKLMAQKFPNVQASASTKESALTVNAIVNPASLDLTANTKKAFRNLLTGGLWSGRCFFS